MSEAGDGREALRLARETRPDIAILDYGLPRLDGTELTRAIKQELPRTEVLIYTMHDSESIVADTLRAGARGYVLKSDSGAHLTAAVEALSLRKSYFSPAISETLVGHLLDPHYRYSVTLTPRERDVVKLVVEGQTNKHIAKTLEITVKTVDTHRAAAMRKLKLNTTAELVRYAIRNHIVRT